MARRPQGQSQGQPQGQGGLIDLDAPDSSAATGLIDLDAPDPRSTAPTPPPRPAAAPSPAPARGRGIADALRGVGDRITGFLGQFGENAGPEQAAGTTAFRYEEPEETRRLARPADRRTPDERYRQARRHVEAQIGAPRDATRVTPTGSPAARAEQSAVRTGLERKATNERNFTPKNIRDLANRGDAYADRLYGEASAVEASDPARAAALRAEAEDAKTKAANAEIVADDAENADTFTEIARSSLLGVVHDPNATARRNLAEYAADPALSFTPEEQTRDLGKNLPVGQSRGFSVAKDITAPLVGSLPLYVAGGVIGRGATRALAAGLEASGATRAATIANALSREIETTGIYGPKQAGLAGVREAGANLAENLPRLAARGATEGQVVGAVQAAREAQQTGGDPIEAAAASTLMNVPFGVVGEVGGGALARALGVADRSVAGALDRVVEHVDGYRGISERAYRDAIGRTNPPPPEIVQAMDQGADAAGKTPVSDKTLEGQRVDLARALERVLAEKEQAPTFGSASGVIQRDPRYLSPIPEPQPEPLRSQLDVARERAGMRPRETVDATVQMQRAAEEQRAIAEQQRADEEAGRIERAAAMAPGRQLGPKTLAETLRDPAYALAAASPAALGDDDEDKNNTWRKTTLTALAVAGGLGLAHRYFNALRSETRSSAVDDLRALYERQEHAGIRSAHDNVRAMIDDEHMEHARYNHPATLDPEFHRRVAEAYESAVSDPTDPQTIAAYEALNEEIARQKAYLESKGVRFEFVEENPYANSAEMMMDVHRNNRLKVFKTPADAFHPLMTAEQNDALRAVHDYIAHASVGNEFGPKGEERAYRMHAATLSPQARRAIATETRGQNSWVNFGPYGEANRADPANTRYAEQKVFLLPEELVNHGIEPLGVERSADALSVLDAPSVEPMQGVLRHPNAHGADAYGAISGDTRGPRVTKPPRQPGDPFYQQNITGLSPTDAERYGEAKLWSRLRRAIETEPFGATEAKPAEAWRARLGKSNRFSRTELDATIGPWLDAADPSAKFTRDDVLAHFDKTEPGIRIVRTEVDDAAMHEMPERLANEIGDYEWEAESANDEMDNRWRWAEQEIHGLGLEPDVVPDNIRTSADLRETLDSIEQDAYDKWVEEHPKPDADDPEGLAAWESDADSFQQESLTPAIDRLRNNYTEYLYQARRAQDASESAQFLRDNADWDDYRSADERPFEHEGQQEYADAAGEGENFQEVRVTLAHMAGGGHYEESHWPNDDNVVVHYRSRDFKRRPIEDLDAKYPPSPEERAAQKRITQIATELSALNAAELRRLRAEGVDVTDMNVARQHVAEETLVKARELNDERARLTDEAARLRHARQSEAQRRAGARERTRVIFEVQSNYAGEAGEAGGFRRQVPITPEQEDALREAMVETRRAYERHIAEVYSPSLERRDDARDALNRALHDYATSRKAEAAQWSDDAGYHTGYSEPQNWGPDKLRAFYEDSRAHDPSPKVDAALDTFTNLHNEHRAVADESYRLEEASRDAGKAYGARGIEHPDAPPLSPVGSTRDAIALGFKQAIIDAVNDPKIERIAWATPEDRIDIASLDPPAAHLIYGEIMPATAEAAHRNLGEPLTIERIPMDHYELSSFKVTPEFRAKVRKYGLEFVSVAALMALPDNAEAQDGKAKGASLYGSGIGGVAAGALIASMMTSKKVRKLVKENRELSRALHLDDLSGLANKRALTRAIESVDRDPALGWIVLDGNRFKAMNDVHGHPEGDKAIAHFGRTLVRVAADHDVPMRGFRAGGDEFAFAAPKAKIAEVMRAIEDASGYTKGEVTTSLTGAYGNTFDEADALLAARKEANRQADPSLRREQPKLTPALSNELRLYANPIGPALDLVKRSPTTATVAAIGLMATQQDDNEYVRRAGAPILALAALHAIGSRRIAAGVDKLAQGLVDQLRKTSTGTAVARAFNPDRLIHPDALAAIKQFERDRARATARASETAKKAKALGPEGDRAVSDVLDNEAWEGMQAQTPAVLAVALELADEYEKATQAQLAAGTLAPEQVIEHYGGPRKYAHYEVAHALADKRGAGGGPSPSPRIAKTNTRTLDIPIREAQRALDDARASGDAAKIKDAQERLDLAEYESAAQRVERGEIREASYRAAAGLEKAYHNVAAAKLFETLRNTPGVAHPEWVSALDEYQTATSLARAAQQSGVQADIDATKLMVGEAAAKLDELKRRFSQKGMAYKALPDTPSLGMLRGAIVARDVAHSLEGFGAPDMWAKALRAWKEVHTVFNPGTNVGNILSNHVALHTSDVPVWLQPKYYKKALADLKSYGPAAKALTEAGLMHVNATNAEGQAVTSNAMRSATGLEELLTTTRPETRQVIERESQANSEYAITEPAIAQRRRNRLKKGAAIGALVGAAKGYNEDDPERAGVGAAVGAAIGALAASGKGDLIRRVYGHEDNIARMAIYLRNLDLGKTHEEALDRATNVLGDFRTRSPALRIVSRTLSPFILYQAKAVPAFAASVVDHPIKYLTLVAAWAAMNEYAKSEVGEIPEQDRDERDRATWGYFFPGFTQLPIANARGDKGATDLSRYTPFGGMATGAPPGSVPDVLSGGQAPNIATPGGPFIDAALRMANVEPMNKKPIVQRDRPVTRGVAKMLEGAADFMLPPALGYHLGQIERDLDNKDYEKLKNDLLGPLGTKPRFIRKGQAASSAGFTLSQELRQIQQELRQDLRANRDPARRQAIVRRHAEDTKAAIEAFRRRRTPPAPGARP